MKYQIKLFMLNLYDSIERAKLSHICSRNDFWPCGAQNDSYS